MSAVEETHLVCLPFAGAGASFFTPWQDRAPEGPHVLPVRLPGREERFVEEPHTDAVRAAAEAHTQVTRQLPEGARVAVFGHSLGAVLGFELAHRLEAEPGVRLDALVVSGAPGPWSGRADRASGLPDAEFLARVRTFAGYAHPALEHPEMRELLLPLLRADVRTHETYRPASDGPLAAYVVADGDIGDVRRRAARLLPDHMLPATVTAVAALPLTPNGKLDRDRLPAPQPAKPAPEPAKPVPVPVAVSPGDLVTALTGVWGEVLGVPVGPDDNVFELGGNSLYAIRVGTALRERGLPALPMRLLYTHPRVRALSGAMGDE